jgi:predicted P-loop ATPase
VEGSLMMGGEPSPIGPFVPEVDPKKSLTDQALSLISAGLQLTLVHAPVLKGGCSCRNVSCESVGKHPIDTAWQARPLVDEEQFRNAFSAKRFTPNIGIILGLQPSGYYLVAIDVDDADRFKELQAEYGALPPTAASESKRGKKLLFVVPPGIEVDRFRNITGLGKTKGVDIKVKGGQVVTPPSIHSNGTVYKWTSTGPIAHLPPAWILALTSETPEPRPAWTFKKREEKVTGRDQKKAQSYLEIKLQDRAALVAGCGEGLRNQTLLHELCSCLSTARGVEREYPAGKYFVIDTLTRAALAAGLPRKEVDQTVKNAEKWIEKEDATHIPSYLRVIDGGGGVASVPPSEPTTGNLPAAPTSVPPRRFEGADALPRITNLQVLPEPWMSELLWEQRSAGRGEDKETWFTPKSCIANALTILAHDARWTGILARDDFKETEVILKMPPWHPSDLAGASVGDWTDADVTRLVSWFERAYGMGFRSMDMDRVIGVASERRRFHPVLEYLEGVVWDETPRLEGALSWYFGAEDTPYTRAVGSRWFKSAVARVIWPGAQVDCTLVFEGAQGLGKNRAIRALVPNPLWVSETRIDIGSKDGLQSLRGKWIIFLDELDALRGKEISKVKSFLTSPKDYYRDSFGRRCRDYWRQCVFAGSTNEEEWLLDTSGNRRFWPVKIVRAIEADRLAAIRDQLWAEAYYRVKAGEAWHVDTVELRALCEEEQTERVHEEPWTHTIATWLEHPIDIAGNVYDARNGVTTTDIATKALGIEPGRVSRVDVMRIASVLKGLSYERLGLKREHGARVRRWIKV